MSWDRVRVIAKDASINNALTGTVTQVSRTGKYRVRIDGLGEVMAGNVSGLTDLMEGDRVSLRLYAGGIGTAEIAGRTARKKREPLVVWR